MGKSIFELGRAAREGRLSLINQPAKAGDDNECRPGQGVCDQTRLSNSAILEIVIPVALSVVSEPKIKTKNRKGRKSRDGEWREPPAQPLQTDISRMSLCGNVRKIL